MSNVNVENVSRHFGDVKAVDNVNITIRSGEFFSLLGPSGCGKTTLLRMLAGLDFPTNGKILIGDKDVTYESAYKRPTNLVFQHLALFPHMTVYDNIAFGLKMSHVPKEEARERILESLRLVALEGYEKRRPSQLSGGQKQRVAIARALVNRPEVLLFDEPLGALDLKLRLQLQEELKNLHRKSEITFIYVTHDQGEAMAMSDRIAVMQSGHVHQIGTPKEIYSKPVNSFVANFIGDTNLIVGTGIGTEGESTLFKVAEGMIVKTQKISVKAGAEYKLSVRHELIKLGDEAKKLDNCFKAYIRDVTFVGQMVRYNITVNGIDMVVNAVNTTTSVIYPRESEIEIGWDSGDVVALQK